MKIEGYVKHEGQVGKVVDYYIDQKGQLVLLGQFEEFPQFRSLRNTKIYKEV